MTATMKALVYEGPRSLTLREQSVPQPREDEVLVRVAAAGICGSELSGYLGHNSLRKPPLVMGHEFAGTVVRCGELVGKLQPGERVTANPLLSCGRCETCLSGRQQLCGRRQLLGAHRPGAFAEYVAVPAAQVYRLPDGMTFARGALTEPLACAVHVCRLLGLSPATRLLITGAGPIGLLTLLAAKLHGVRSVTVTDVNGERLEAVQALGGLAVDPSSAEGRELLAAGGFDAACDAVGIQATRTQCVRALKPGGRLALTGLHEAEAALPINDIIRSEIELKGAFAYGPLDFQLALDWLAAGLADLRPWTEFSGLDEGAACFERLLTGPGSVAKIMFHLEEECE